MSECVSWSMQGCKGGMDFLVFHPCSPRARADCLQTRNERKKTGYYSSSLASQDWEMSAFAADASVSH